LAGKKLTEVTYFVSGGTWNLNPVCCRRVSTRLSVTSRHCTKTAERRITQSTPYSSPMTLVFWCQRSRRDSNRGGK